MGTLIGAANASATKLADVTDESPGLDPRVTYVTAAGVGQGGGPAG